jgi:hypothetical protein
VSSNTVEDLYRQLLAKVDMLYKYAIAHNCDKAKKVADELLTYDVFKQTYADDIRFSVRGLVSHACYDTGDATLLYKWLRRGIWGHLSKQYGPLPYPD